jgi:hypothetical protein
VPGCRVQAASASIARRRPAEVCASVSEVFDFFRSDATGDASDAAAENRMPLCVFAKARLGLIVSRHIARPLFWLTTKLRHPARCVRKLSTSQISSCGVRVVCSAWLGGSDALQARSRKNVRAISFLAAATLASKAIALRVRFQTAKVQLQSIVLRPTKLREDTPAASARRSSIIKPATDQARGRCDHCCRTTKRGVWNREKHATPNAEAQTRGGRRPNAVNPLELL